MDTMDIGAAVSAMRAGHRVARAGWNGKGMWLALYVPARPESCQPHDHAWYPECPTCDEALAMVTEPFVVMRTAQGGLAVWNCSQADLLATDWVLAP